jgi:hypothetical protein
MQQALTSLLARGASLRVKWQFSLTFRQLAKRQAYGQSTVMRVAVVVPLTSAIGVPTPTAS